MMIDEWFDARVDLCNQKLLHDSNNEGEECCATDKENRQKLLLQNKRAQNISPQHNINDSCNQLSLFHVYID